MMASFFKRQVLSRSPLHYLLTDPRDNETVLSLWNHKDYESRCKNSTDCFYHIVLTVIPIAIVTVSYEATLWWANSWHCRHFCSLGLYLFRCRLCRRFTLTLAIGVVAYFIVFVFMLLNAINLWLTDWLTDWLIDWLIDWNWSSLLLLLLLLLPWRRWRRRWWSW